MRPSVSLHNARRFLGLRLAFVLLLAALLVSSLSPTLIQSAEAFDKHYPKHRVNSNGGADAGEEKGGNTKSNEDSQLARSNGRKQPGTYSPAELEAAMPDYNDPIDGPQLECTACLSVSDIIAKRFSKLKTEFRLTMEQLRPYHVDAALDDLCSNEQRFVGLLMPNVTNHLGKRVDTTFRTERIEKEDQILSEAKKKNMPVEKENKQSNKKQQKGGGKDKRTSKKKPKDDKRTQVEKKLEEEEKEWKRAGLDEFAIARRKRLRLNFSIWPEYADEREIRRKLKGGKPEDVTVLRSLKIHTEWQRFCSEAMSRMESFGVLKVFRGSKSFNLCPMCRSDDPLAQGRTHNPGGVSSNAEEANAVSDTTLRKREREQKKREVTRKLQSKVVDAGDDDDDEQFIRGKSDDEFEL